LLDGRKLGGILIESRVLGDERFFFAIGFGLNLFMSAEELACLDRPATSISLASAQASDQELDRNALLVASIEAVITANRSFEIDGVSALINDFADLDAYHETSVEVICGEQRITGINRGIDESGQLRLETNRGIELFSAAEISLREAGA
jgi:BirA family biotin operon repressor/biotin-[acetyl-CoA-carboxylase] ligase